MPSRVYDILSIYVCKHIVSFCSSLALNVYLSKCRSEHQRCRICRDSVSRLIKGLPMLYQSGLQRQAVRGLKDTCRILHLSHCCIPTSIGLRSCRTGRHHLPFLEAGLRQFATISFILQSNFIRLMSDK